MSLCLPPTPATPSHSSAGEHRGCVLNTSSVQGPSHNPSRGEDRPVTEEESEGHLPKPWWAPTLSTVPSFQGPYPGGSQTPGCQGVDRGEAGRQMGPGTAQQYRSRGTQGPARAGRAAREPGSRTRQTFVLMWESARCGRGTGCPGQSEHCRPSRGGVTDNSGSEEQALYVVLSAEWKVQAGERGG